MCHVSCVRLYFSGVVKMAGSYGHLPADADLYLEFTESFFNRINIRTGYVKSNLLQAEAFDRGLRNKIIKNSGEIAPGLGTMAEDPDSEHAIILAEDRFRCQYLIIPAGVRHPEEASAAGEVPDSSPAPQGGAAASELSSKTRTPFFLVAGPFLVKPMAFDEIQELCRKQKIPPELTGLLGQYYSTLPLFSSENIMEAFAQTLGQALFGAGGYALHYYHEKVPGETSHSAYHAEARIESGESAALELARRYDIEEKLMDAIARGDTQEALRCQRDPVFSNLDARVDVPLRNMKNYTIILNTLCRKAAQRGGVHPVYLDEISRRIAIQIENSESIARTTELNRDIVRRYCMLVQSHTTQGYSPLVSRIISYIQIHYSDTELTLSSVASKFSLNKSYLAALFKKETGATFTNYVNARRIEQAIYLMNTQSGSIQSIASACGLPDTTYFTRLFRREKGMTPTEYRKMLLNK